MRTEVTGAEVRVKLGCFDIRELMQGTFLNHRRKMEGNISHARRMVCLRISN